jgi:hypothetical protein
MAESDARPPDALTPEALTFTDNELRLLTLAGTAVLASLKGREEGIQAAVAGIGEHGGSRALGLVLMRIASHMELVEETGALDG